MIGGVFTTEGTETRKSDLPESGFAENHQGRKAIKSPFGLNLGDFGVFV